MEIQGPRNPGRPEPGRAGAASDGARRSGKPAASTDAAGDLVDVGGSRFIDRSVERLRHELERRAADLRARRAELLERADDPDAIRRAAAALLRAGVDAVEPAE